MRLRCGRALEFDDLDVTRVLSREQARRLYGLGDALARVRGGQQEARGDGALTDDELVDALLHPRAVVPNDGEERDPFCKELRHQAGSLDPGSVSRVLTKVPTYATGSRSICARCSAPL
jgi:hypothetical protein